RGERLDVATLSLGVEGVEGERRLPRPARPRDDRQLADRNVAIDAAKVVLPYAAKPDRGMRRGAIRARPRLRWRFRLGGGAYARARASSDHEKDLLRARVEINCIGGGLERYSRAHLR